MSRDRVLASIRSALGQDAPPEHATPARTYDVEGSLSPAERKQLFVDRLHEYDARVFACAPSQVAATIAQTLRSAGKQRMLAPSGVPSASLCDGVEWVSDESLSYEQIERVDGVLTSATVAVAESGTIVLSHGAGEGRRVLTLLPDYHLCVLRASQIVETLPECFARLADLVRQPLTFISGPSATADIEMTRIKGVHGPRFLDVVLLSDEAGERPHNSEV